MIKRTGFLAIIAICFAFTMQAQKIAVVDVALILESSTEYATAEKEIDRLSSEWRQEISLKLDDVKSLYNKYQAEQVLLSDDIRGERENQIMAKEEEVRELQKRRFGPEGDLFKKRQELIAPVQDKVFAAVEEFASDRGYDIIFDKGSATGLLFANDDYDKTDEVMRRLGVK